MTTTPYAFPFKFTIYGQTVTIKAANRAQALMLRDAHLAKVRAAHAAYNRQYRANKRPSGYEPKVRDRIKFRDYENLKRPRGFGGTLKYVGCQNPVTI